MKWWGWLVIAVVGPIMWVRLLVARDTVGWVENDTIFGGIIFIWGCCIVIPLVQKVIKAAKRGK